MAPLCISSKFTVAAYTESVLYDKTYVLKNDETFSEQGNIESAFFFYFMADAINGLADWQQYKLKKREVNPYLVSLDVITQVATQPSRYYLVNPRVRGNWGLFSSDFRVNRSTTKRMLSKSSTVPQVYNNGVSNVLDQYF